MYFPQSPPNSASLLCQSYPMWINRDITKRSGQNESGIVALKANVERIVTLVPFCNVLPLKLLAPCDLQYLPLSMCRVLIWVPKLLIALYQAYHLCNRINAILPVGSERGHKGWEESNCCLVTAGSKPRGWLIYVGFANGAGGWGGGPMLGLPALTDHPPPDQIRGWD